MQMSNETQLAFMACTVDNKGPIFTRKQNLMLQSHLHDMLHQRGQPERGQC